MNWHWTLPQVGDMKQQGQKQYLFDNPRNVSRFFKGFYAICILLLLLDFVLHRHIMYTWEDFTGFYAFFGFVACVTLVLTAKQLRKILKRKEDYYDVDS